MDLSNIAEVEKVFQEFYDPLLSNQRKFQLEQIIGHIKSHPNAWVNARYYISKSNSQYLLFAAVTIFEEMIKNGRWDAIPMEDQIDIRNLLLEFLLAKNRVVPSYVCNKVAKVLVDIGKYDWPHKFPDFFNNVMRLTQSSQTHAIGVNMVTLMSEEFVASKDDLLDTRKVQLKNHLMSCLPQILHQLNSLLEGAYEQARVHSLSHSPVPGNVSSPPGPQSPGTLSPPHHQSPQGRSPKPSLQFDKDTEALAKAVFDTLERLFSWIPLSDFVRMALVNTLFKYAQIGDTNGVAALGCINEILSKSYVPREFEEFLMAVFHQLVIVMQNLTQSPMMMQSVQPEYLDRVTYFTSLFVKNHLRRVKTSPNFPVLDFLRLLFSFTFAQPMSDTDGFTSCLDIWGSFLDILSSSPAEDRRVYFEGLMALQLELQKKVLFNTNAAQLNTLDNVGDSSTKIDEEEESGSEFDMFVSRCLEIISKVAELFPHEVVESLYPLFGQNLDNYFRVAAVVQANGYSPTVGNVIMDMGTVTRLFGRLVNNFVIDFEARFQPTVLLYTKMLEMLQYAVASNMMSLPVFPDFCCRVLGSLHAFSHWLEAYTMHAQIRTAGTAAHGYNDYVQLITRILDTSTSLLSYVQQQHAHSQAHQLPTSPVHKSPLSSSTQPHNKTMSQKYDLVGVQVGHVLESLCASVRPPILDGLPPFEALVNGLHGVAPQLPPTCASKVYNAITAATLFPQPSSQTTLQQWEVKRAKYLPFVKVLTNAYVEVSKIPGFVDNKIFAQDDVQRRIIFTSEMLASIVRLVNNEPTQVKTILSEGLGDSLSITLGFFRVYVASPQGGLPVLEHILDFFLAAFEALPAQVGVAFTEQTINTFLEKLSEQKQGTEGMGGGGRGGGGSGRQDTWNVVLTKLLQILTVVMSTPGPKYESLLPAVISFCLKNVFPQLSGNAGMINGNTNSSLDVRNQFYTLLPSLLLQHWKAAGNMHAAIINALEYPFSSHDVGLFKQALDAFESLNSKMRLYSKDVFIEQHHRFTLLRTLLYVLLAKTHDNLRDELIITIYNIAAVDFDSFFKQFLGGFLGSATGLTDPQRNHLLSNFAPDKDQPTFNSHITQFINDYRYFMTRNNPSSG